MKSICFTIRNIDCGGGTERVGLRLANALAEQGYTVYMVDYDSKRHRPFFEVHPRLRLWTILSHGGLERKMRWHFWYGAWKFRRFLKRHHIDVVIDIDTFNANWTAPAVRGLNVRWISWAHFNYAYSSDGPLRQQALDYIRTGADMLVLLSQADKESYLKLSTISPKKLVQIYNPLSFEETAYVPRTAKRVIAIGRIDWLKGFDLLLKSWCKVEQQVSDWCLEIVCGYGDYQALQREAESMGLKRVSCTPPTTDVRGKLAGSGIFAFPSRSESFGLVLTEAATMGVPMVSYDCPAGPSEIITQGVDGYLVKPEDTEAFADRLIELMRNDDLRLRMGRAAHESAKRFGMKRILPQWIELIERKEKDNENE